MTKQRRFSVLLGLACVVPACDAGSSDTDVCELAAEVTAECHGEGYFPIDSCDPDQARALLEDDCDAPAPGKSDGGSWPVRRESLLLLPNRRRSVWFENSVQLSFARNENVRHENAACWLTDGTVQLVPVQSWGSGFSVRVPSSMSNRIRRSGCRLDFIWDDYWAIGGIDVTVDING